VNDLLVASGEKRMHERGDGGKKKPKATADDRLQAKIDEAEDLLDDPEVLEGIKADVADLKNARKVTATVKAWQAEAEAAQAEAEREEQRLAEAARKQLGKARDYWPELQRQVNAFTKLLGIYFRDFDDLPSPQPHELRLLDGAFENLRTGIDHFENKLHPGGKHRLRQGAVIDVHMN
jgi:hypothetical protein